MLLVCRTRNAPVYGNIFQHCAAISTYMHTCIWMNKWICTHIYFYTNNVKTYTQTHTNNHTHTCARAYAYTQIYVYMYVCIYVYVCFCIYTHTGTDTSHSAVFPVAETFSTLFLWIIFKALVASFPTESKDTPEDQLIHIEYPMRVFFGVCALSECNEWRKIRIVGYT